MVDYIKDSFKEIIAGDDIQWDATYKDEDDNVIDITNWIIRAEIWNNDKQIKLATANQAGGADNQIEITDALQGKFSIYVLAGKTDNMAGEVSMEIEFEPPDGKTVTPLKLDFIINEKKIDWDDPTV